MGINTILQVLRNSNAKGHARHMLICYADHVNEKCGYTFISIGAIAREMGISRRQAIRIKMELIRSHALKVMRISGRVGHQYVTTPTRELNSSTSVTHVTGDAHDTTQTSDTHDTTPVTPVSPYPGSYPGIKDKKETAPLRGANSNSSIQSREESEMPPQNHQADTPGHDTHIESGKPKSEEKIQTAPHTYKPASARNGVTISAMREIDGFSPQSVIDLWNGLAETAGLKPFVEQLDDRMRLRILKRQHEKPDPDWWASKLRDVSRHKWSVEVQGVTFSWLLSERGWQKLSCGEFAPKPPAPRKLSL